MMKKKYYRKQSYPRVILLLIGSAALLIGLLWLKTPGLQNPIPRWQGIALVEEPQISLYRHEEDQVISMSMEEYILGVMMAEMPLLFGEEALKAQAVCARTYALSNMAAGAEYPLNANMSDDIWNCQAFISLADYQERNPQVSSAMLEMARRAVESTRGEVLIYDGGLIEAVYHASCGGQTANANQVWSGDRAYLRSVACDGRDCKEYQDYYSWTAQEACLLLGLAASDSIAMELAELDESGRALRVRVNDHEFSGAEIRHRLELPSTWISIKKEGSDLEIQSQGYGHGVGLCQRGAGSMGAEGNNYQEILYHYYPGVKLVRLPW